MKIILIVSVLMVSFSSFSKMNNQNLGEFSSECYKRYASLKNFPQVCECQKENLRWLLDDSDWNIARQLYLDKVSQVEIDATEGLNATDNMIAEVEIKCTNDTNYLAPKAKRLKAESKK